MSLKENLKISEGFRENVYKCTMGYDTVGYGFKCSDLSKDELALNNGKVAPMKEEVASKILDIKIEKLKNKVFKSIPWLENKPQIVQDVLLEMAYQMGVAGLLGFKNTLKMIENNDYKNAANGMMNSKWAKQTPNRAKRLANEIAGV